MAPSKAASAPYAKDEKVLCFHHEMLYEAKILDFHKGDGNEGWQFKIHYKGWKSTWDDWVPEDRVRKFNEENRELAQQLLAQARATMAKSSKQSKKSAAKNGSDFSSARGSEERTGGAGAASSRGPRRARDYDLEQEDTFHNRPSIKLVVPDHIKAILVDDWENITKNCLLVPLPHHAPVEQILKDYMEHERPNREEGSASLDILEETISGLREYFDKALGKILLYRFERAQYASWRAKWDVNNDEGPSTTYGAEHLCRLIVSLPELVGQTNMDQQSVNRLREEVTKLTNWLGKHAKNYFVPEYENPGPEYVEKAKN